MEIEGERLEEEQEKEIGRLAQDAQQEEHGASFEKGEGQKVERQKGVGSQGRPETGVGAEADARAAESDVDGTRADICLDGPQSVGSGRLSQPVHAAVGVAQRQQSVNANRAAASYAAACHTSGFAGRPGLHSARRPLSIAAKGRISFHFLP
jgi:hypothetical protein